MPKILLSLRPTLIVFGGLLTLSACAQPPADAEPVSWRLQLNTVREWPQADELATQVARIARVTVRPDVAAFAPRGYALTLQCRDAQHCEEAVSRLRAASALVTAVQRDETRQIPSPSTRATAP
jgi:hypothetical protein